MQPARDEIARRAYFLYVARDRRDGADLDDWLQAERQVVGEKPSEQARPRSTAKRVARPRSR